MKLLLLLLAFASAAAPPLCGQLGPLPAGAVATESVRGVHGELGFPVLVDPDALTGLVPEGIRLLRAGSFGLPDSILPASAADFVPSFFVVLLADTIELDGSPIRRPRSDAGSMAFWWLYTEDVAPVRDERARGITQALQLGIWFNDSVATASYAAKGIAAAPAVIEGGRVGNEWTFSFAIPGSEVRGQCRLLGEPLPLTYSLPAYSTVWHSGPVPSLFSVFTFAGHRSQACEVIEFDASGVGTLARAIRASNDLLWPRARVDDGWIANSATFRVER